MPRAQIQFMSHGSTQSMEVLRASKYPPRQTPFGILKNNLGEFNPIGFEEAIERIVKRVCECQFKTRVDPLLEKKQIESTCQSQSHPQIVCWICKGLGHCSRDYEVNKLQFQAKFVGELKSKVSTHTIESQIDSL